LVNSTGNVIVARVNAVNTTKRKELLKEEPTQRTDPRRDGFASADEASQFLSVSRAMVTKLVASGRMPHKRFGRALRIPWAWLLAQVEEASK
jgi:excisionase family DNA binding protein